MDFKEKLSDFIKNSLQSSKTLEQIYEKAEERQADLVAECFDLCAEVICKSNKFSKAELQKKGLIKRDGSIIKSQDFMISGQVFSEQTIRSHRGRLTSFLEEVSPLYVIDSGVKSFDRAKEKIDFIHMGQDNMIKDVNRLTIVSKDYQLIEDVIKSLRKKAKDESLCVKEQWDMKSFGMLSRSNYLKTKGFISEIHFNEPEQIKLGDVVTHNVYEVMRINMDDDIGRQRFEEEFVNLPKTVKHSILRKEFTMSDEMKKYSIKLSMDLTEMVSKYANSSTEAKQSKLLEFNRNAHQEMISKSDVRWQVAYLQSLYSYNSNTELAKNRMRIQDDKAFKSARVYIAMQGSAKAKKNNGR